MQRNLTVWVEGTIIAALATVLSLVPFNIGPSFSVTVGAPVVLLYCFRRGFVPGVYAGFLWGVLHILIGTAWILSPLQGFIEYFVAFGFTGLAGLYAPGIKRAVLAGDQRRVLLLIFLGTVVGTVARYFWHTIAGYYFWGSYAPEGWSAWLYSIVMNGASALATGIFSVVVLIAVWRTAAQLFTVKQLPKGY